MTDAEQFRADLLASLPASAITAVNDTFNRWAGRSIYLPKKTRYTARIRAARLLVGRVTQREAVAILAERFGLSPRQARRYFQTAAAEFRL
jgi:hypothetical protein